MGRPPRPSRAAALLLAAPALSAAASFGVRADTCPLGSRPLAPLPRDALLSDCTAEEGGAAMAFIQKALEYKARQTKLRDTAPPAPSAAAAASLADHLGASRAMASATPPLLMSRNSPGPAAAAPAAAFPPCLPGDEDGMPFSVQARSNYELLTGVGIVPRVPVRCHHKEELALMHIPDNGPELTVHEKNEVAEFFTMLWISVGVFLVGWSVYSVVRVHSKASRPQQPKARLADEQLAWNRGFISWVNLSWADDLMGRYGKNWSAVVAEEEIAPSDPRSGGSYGAPARSQAVFRQAWKEEVRVRGMAEASVGRAIFKAIGIRGCVTLFCTVAVDQTAGMLGMVVVLEKFITYLAAMQVEQAAHPFEELSFMEPTMLVFFAAFAVPMVFRCASIFTKLVDGHYTQICTSALASVVFEKAMNLPVGSAPKQELSEEEDPNRNMNPNVIQLYNTDIMECWGGLLTSIFMIIIGPIMLVIQFAMLVVRIHMAGVVGFLYSVPASLFTIAIVRVNLGFWRSQQGFQDRRLKKFTEAIMHIRTLKSLALEATVFEQLESARRSELKFLQGCVLAGGMIISIAQSIPWGSVLLALFYLMKSEGAVTAVQILIVQRLMGSMLLSIVMIHGCIHKLIVFPNSFARIKRYLSQEERPRMLTAPPPSDAEGAPVLQVKGSFSFLPDSPATLQDLDITIRRGELVAVIGSVASGKTALLQTLFGELFPASEDAVVTCPDADSGKLAFCSQVPWIFEGTLRENVVMQATFDQKKYFQALHAAALTPDLETLPGADMVMIGSHGIRLSGGQRARVALARAAYMDRSEVVVMDDPFASVDVGTSTHLFEQLVLGAPMANRTRVVVMQPTASRLRQFDKVILLDGGRVAICGTPDEVLGSAPYKKLLNMGDEKAVGGPGAISQGDANGAEAVAMVCRKKNNEMGTALREAEEQDHITMKTLRWWLRLAGYKNLAFFLGMVLCNRFLDVFQTVLLASWINAKTAVVGGETCDDTRYMLQILFRTLAASCSIIITSFASSRVTMSASAAIHTQTLATILRAPIDKFFDKQPIGRLVNRLSADMRTTDDAVPFVFQMLFGFVASFVIAEGYILRVLPWRMVVAACPFFAIAFFFAYIYRGTVVPLIFANKFAMSRVHDLQAVCITSNMSIRCNGMLAEFISKFEEQSALVIRCNYLSHYVCLAWMQSRIFLCLSVLTSVFTLTGLWGRMPLGTVSIIYVLSTNQLNLFENLSSLLTHALNVFNALQRLARYLDIPQEPPSAMPSDPVVRISALVKNFELASLEVREIDKAGTVGVFLSGGASPLLVADAASGALVLHDGRRLDEIAPRCPSFAGAHGCFHIVTVNGETKDLRTMAEELCRPQSACWVECWHRSFAGGLGVKFEKLTAGYSTEKAVLQSVSFVIPPRMKCGIAGATGCGKSTTLLCLLRILEARSGRILVGPLDISRLGLKLLRTIVGLVPQDATIFEGSWRQNVDPFQEYPDGRVWDALRCAHLLAHVRALPDGIDSKITEDGGNISFGQKQMLSLARMVIRQPPVLLLDECTSALDPNTQMNVQNTVLNAFPISTVISIAHRVETLLEFDQVIVLDQGSVMECGSIQDVLSIEGGRFANMMKHVRK
mmetsp:Transcript_18363/g.52566  ORF Transcript_18363/g.52566 Transcript_18363/m.52566 type:complete len:1618 (-) Transcript_18363:50-4903(-)